MSHKNTLQLASKYATFLASIMMSSLSFTLPGWYGYLPVPWSTTPAQATPAEVAQPANQEELADLVIISASDLEESNGAGLVAVQLDGNVIPNNGAQSTVVFAPSHVALFDGMEELTFAEFLQAVQDGNRSRLDQLLGAYKRREINVNINGCDEQGNSLLRLAVEGHHGRLVRQLVRAGAKTTYINENGIEAPLVELTYRPWWLLIGESRKDKNDANLEPGIEWWLTKYPLHLSPKVFGLRQQVVARWVQQHVQQWKQHSVKVWTQQHITRVKQRKCQEQFNKTRQNAINICLTRQLMRQAECNQVADQASL